MILLDNSNEFLPWIHLIVEINKIVKNTIHFNDLYLFWMQETLNYDYDFNDKEYRSWDRNLDEIEDIWVKKVNIEDYPEYYI